MGLQVRQLYFYLLISPIKGLIPRLIGCLFWGLGVKGFGLGLLGWTLGFCQHLIARFFALYGTV